LRLRLSPEAAADLDAIFAYIARDNPNAAQSVIERIGDTLDLLRQFPHIGRRSSAHGVSGLVVERLPYIVFHQIDEQERLIVVLRVYHTARKRPF
jgi:toxin ParE1/3/4